MKINLTIYGIDCAACSRQIKTIFEKYPDIYNIKVNYNSSSVYFETNDIPDFKKIEKSLKIYGYSLVKSKVVIKTDITKFNNKKEEIFKEISYFSNYEINNNEVILYFYLLDSNLNKLIKTFKDNNINIEIVKKESSNDEVLAKNQVNILTKLVVSLFLTIPLLWNPSPILQFILATIILLYPASYFFKGAIKIFHGNLNMDFLITLSSLLVYGYSSYLAFTSTEDIKLYFLCEGVLITLVLFGRYLEVVAKGEAERSLSGFANLIPRKCTLYKDNNEFKKDIDEVNIKDILIIKTGERIPIDGKIIKGDALIDESIITGESEFINKTINDEVIGGTLLKKGDILIEVTHIGDETVVNKMIEIVKNSQLFNSNYKKIADKIIIYFIPSVIAISILTFSIWYFFVDAYNLENALLSSIGVLVVSCPCALGLAIPTSLMVGFGRASELGILFKNGETIEKTKKIKTIVFDKTGTLTYGGESEKRNEIREGVKETIERLSKKYKIVMISGDKKDIALNIAKNIGINEVYYEIKAINKADIIEKLKNEGPVLMVGDGVNDAPAMSKSDISISIQNATQIAKDTADIIILKDDIKKVDSVFEISSKIMKNIYINLIWALIYNLIAIPLAACGLINPSIASAAMSFSSIAVILNSLSLKKIKE